MDKDKLIFIIFFSIGILFMIGLFIITTIYKSQMDEYCINGGYEGSANSNTDLKDFRCYKYVKHESGFGSEIVYSGLVRLD